MPLNDWTKVDDGIFHDFHSSWIIHLKESLNEGLLPDGFYALAEQHARDRIPDVLTLHVPERDLVPGPLHRGRGIALFDAPPKVSRKLVADSPAYRARRRTVTIRHTSNHRIVALLEIVSPGNKDRASSVASFVDKVDAALASEIHVMVVDLFPPGKHDPRGIHGAIWASYSLDDCFVPSDHPLTLASYRADGVVEAYLEHLTIGDPLIDMPLFLDSDFYVNVPLEATYQVAYRGVPTFLAGRARGEAAHGVSVFDGSLVRGAFAMPVHDWRQVETGTFHAFHNAWNTHLMGRLNGGILPNGYYALAEQYVRGRVPDVLTFQVPGPAPNAPPVSGPGDRGIALADFPPRVRHRLVADENAAYRSRQRTLTIRRTSGHRIVAMLEIVSPANKDRASSVQDFVKKVESVLVRSIHVLVADLILPGKHDPRGVHGEIWSRYASEDYDLPGEQPLTLSSYLAGDEVEAYVEHLNFGDPLPEMPLFLDDDTYIYVPLETTYQAAYLDLPDFWRDVLEGKQPTM